MIPHLGNVEFSRDDLEPRLFQAARLGDNTDDMQVSTRCQNSLHFAAQQEKQH